MRNITMSNEMNIKKAYVATNGCHGSETQVRQYAETFSRKGYLLTARVEDADVIVADLCSFTHQAKSDSVGWLKSIESQRKPTSEVIVTGCYLGINPGSVEAVVPRVRYMTKEQMRTFSGNTLATPIVPGYVDAEGVLKLKIEDGCGGKCTFCAIPNGVGRRYSYPLDLIMSTIQNYVGEHPGTTVKFVGEDIGFYGLDRKDGTTILTLLDKVKDLEGDFNVRIDVVNPWWFLRYPHLIDSMAEGVCANRIVPYVGVPLQSGSDTILKSMKRLYSRLQFEGVLDTLLEKIPSLGLSSEVIVGFPGETDTDFKHTFEVVDKYNFNPLGVWGYTPFEGTDSFHFENKVNSNVIQERMEMLVALVIDKEKKKRGCTTLEELCAQMEQQGFLPLNTNGKNLFTGVRQ